MNVTASNSTGAGTGTEIAVLAILAALVVAVVVILRSKASRVIKYDVTTITTVFFMGAILVLINAIPAALHQLSMGSVKIPLEYKKDFTQNQRNTISDDTIKILDALPRDVDVTAFYYHGKPEEKAAQDLFDQYRYYSPHFKYHFIDPLTDPTAALRYKDVMRLIDPTHVTILPGTVVLEMADPTSTPPVRRVSVQLPTTGKAGEAESKLSNALLQLEVKEKKTIYFTSGHGERTPDARGPQATASIGKLKDALEQSVYQVKTFNVYQENKIPSDADIVMIVGPQKDFSQGELDLLKAWVDKGGRLMVMVDPGSALPNLSAFLASYNIQLGNDLVIDPQRGFNHNPASPCIAQFSSTSPITDGYNIECFFGATRSVSQASKAGSNVRTDVIARTLDEAWALPVDKGVPPGAIQFDPKVDTKGPIGAGMSATIPVAPPATPSPSPAASPAATPKPEGRLVVFGDSGFVSGDYFLLFGNGDLFLRAVNWLGDRGETHIAIRPVVNSKPLVLTDAQKWRLWWISFMLIPGTIAMIGIVVFMLFKPN